MEGLIVIPRVRTLAGLVTWAKTYRLVFDGQFLWVIHLGRAMRPGVEAKDPLANFFAQLMIRGSKKRIEERLDEVEEEIGSVSLATLLERKGCFRVSVEEQGAVRCELNPEFEAALIVKSVSGRKRFYGLHEELAEPFAQIAAAFGSGSKS
ncbi:MAG: hypothetical protein ACSHYB_01915 [Roseibacillus sp.]